MSSISFTDVEASDILRTVHAWRSRIAKQLPDTLAVVWAMSRLNWVTDHKNCLQAMPGWIGDALVTYLMKTRGKKQGEKTWCEKNVAILNCVMRAYQSDAVLACKDNFSAVSQERYKTHVGPERQLNTHTSIGQTSGGDVAC